MRRKAPLSLELFGDRLPLQKDVDDGGAEHRRMLAVLARAVRGELTQRQMECLHMRYEMGMSVNEIAQELGVGAPTVSKHLKKARARLAKVMRYYFSRLQQQ